MKVTTLKEFDVVRSDPGNKGYDILRQGFCRIVGSPPLTGIVLRRPADRLLKEKDFLVARYCLEQIVAGQVCVSTGYGPIDIDRFFAGLTISGEEQIHLLAHLVLANLATLTEDSKVQDALFMDDKYIHLWFSAELPAHEFRHVVAHLMKDLDALLDGRIQGYVDQAIFR